jgi:8-oxo-dGTP pyrophosphatase MutT (NUDIX family)
MKKQTQQPNTLSSTTSKSSNQSVTKSVSSPTRREFCMQIGVKILIIDKDDMKFLALRRNRNISKLYFDESIDIPGGRILFGEEPIEGLKREIYEEIGITLRNKPMLIHAGNIIIDKTTHIVRLTYMVKEKVNINNILLGSEHIVAEFLTLKKDESYHPLLNEAINECLNKINSK